MLYQVYQIKDPSRPGPAGLVTAIEDMREQIERNGAGVFGVFGSLLGLASNQVYLVTFGESELDIQLPSPFERVSTTTLKPTIRPVSHQPVTEPGVYVFRWFRVSSKDVHDIVQLSGEAWPTFEEDFDTRVQGLFVQDTPEPDTMLLITWYRNMAEWEASRQPRPEARENFLKRHQLTHSALPIATALMGDNRPGLVSHA